MIKQIQMASIIGAVFGLASISMPAHAHMDGACKEDMKKLCGDLKPGDGRLKDCMKSHEADLSQACKDNMAEGKEKWKEKREEMKEACQADIKQFCADVTPGEGREMACLHAHSDKLSAGCKEKMPKGHMGKHKGMHHHDKDGGNRDDGPPEPPVPASK